jgi:hypothetical protein
MSDGSNQNGPFWGDVVYVALSGLLLVVVTIAVLVAVAALNSQTQSSFGTARSDASLLAPLACLIPIYLAWVLVLKGIYEGRKWAFIVELVLTVLSVAIPSSAGSPSRLAAAAGFGALLTIARCIYFALRLGGVIGPPLR